MAGLANHVSVTSSVSGIRQSGFPHNSNIALKFRKAFFIMVDNALSTDMLDTFVVRHEVPSC